MPTSAPLLAMILALTSVPRGANAYFKPCCSLCCQVNKVDELSANAGLLNILKEGSCMSNEDTLSETQRELCYQWFASGRPENAVRCANGLFPEIIEPDSLHTMNVVSFMDGATPGALVDPLDGSELLCADGSTPSVQTGAAAEQGDGTVWNDLCMDQRDNEESALRRSARSLGKGADSMRKATRAAHDPFRIFGLGNLGFTNPLDTMPNADILVSKGAEVVAKTNDSSGSKAKEGSPSSGEGGAPGSFRFRRKNRAAGQTQLMPADLDAQTQSAHLDDSPNTDSVIEPRSGAKASATIEPEALSSTKGIATPKAQLVGKEPSTNNPPDFNTVNNLAHEMGNKGEDEAVDAFASRDIRSAESRAGEEDAEQQLDEIEGELAKREEDEEWTRAQYAQRSLDEGDGPEQIKTRNLESVEAPVVTTGDNAIVNASSKSMKGTEWIVHDEVFANKMHEGDIFKNNQESESSKGTIPASNSTRDAPSGFRNDASEKEAADDQASSDETFDDEASDNEMSDDETFDNDEASESVKAVEESVKAAKESSQDEANAKDAPASDISSERASDSEGEKEDATMEVRRGSQRFDKDTGKVIAGEQTHANDAPDAQFLDGVADSDDDVPSLDLALASLEHMDGAARDRSIESAATRTIDSPPAENLSGEPGSKDEEEGLGMREEVGDDILSKSRSSSDIASLKPPVYTNAAASSLAANLATHDRFERAEESSATNLRFKKVDSLLA
jgi:hypothetical protein